jgi:hypothetical protein
MGGEGEGVLFRIGEKDEVMHDAMEPRQPYKYVTAWKRMEYIAAAF